MTDETPKPKRRRWIIAGVLLFVFAVAAWWYWPRGDQRLIGKWRFSDGKPASPTSLQWEFRSNGIGVVTFGANTSSARSFVIVWRAEGDQLIFGRKTPGRIQGVLASVQQSLGRFFGMSFIYTHEHYTLDSCSENTITFHDTGIPNEPLILTRITE